MKFAAFLFAVVMVVSSAFAVVPTTMTYQAIFTDLEGNVMPDGVYEIGFHIFSSAIGGPPVWSEWQDVTVTDGVFEVTLGTIFALDPSDFLDPEGDGLWMSLEYNDTWMHPRQFISSVPFAFISCWADSSRKAALADSANQAAHAYMSDNSTLHGGFTIAQVISFLTIGRFEQTDATDIALQADVQVTRSSNTFTLTRESVVYYYATTSGLADPTICCGRGDILAKIVNTANSQVVDQSSRVASANPGSLSAVAFSVILQPGTYRIDADIINTMAVTYESIEFGAFYQGD